MGRGGGLRSSTGKRRPPQGRKKISRDTQPCPAGARIPAAATAHLPGAGHRGAVDLEGAHAAIAAAPLRSARRREARREGTGGPAAARHVTAGTNGAGGPGHAASAGPGPGQPAPIRTGPLWRSGAEQLYFILKILSTNEWVRQRLVEIHCARRDTQRRTDGGARMWDRVGRWPWCQVLGCSVKKGPRFPLPGEQQSRTADGITILARGVQFCRRMTRGHFLAERNMRAGQPQLLGPGQA